MTSGSLWNYYKDKVYDENDTTNNRIHNRKITSKSFELRQK